MNRIVFALALLGVLAPGLACSTEMILDCPSAHCRHTEQVARSSTIVYVGKCKGGAGKMECAADKKSPDTTCTETGQDSCTCTNGNGSKAGNIQIDIAC